MSIGFPDSLGRLSKTDEFLNWLGWPVGWLSGPMIGFSISAREDRESTEFNFASTKAMGSSSKYRLEMIGTMGKSGQAS